MADVFISYSRKDTDFVRRLNDALERQRRQVWVDWEDIPRGVEWLNEIYAGIEQAHTFVFVVSPDSLISRICNFEVAHALKLHKRIVPIIRREIDEKAVAGEWFNQEWEQMARDNWQALRSINWLKFQDSDDFDAEFAQLLQALDSDPEHVRAHTRLLVRAVEWDAKRRDSSLLLRGIDLNEAEVWLAQAASKQPAPTTLHTEYITSSRREEARRQRSLLGGVSVALVVALALAGLSFILYQQSQSNLVLAGQRGTEVAQQAATATNALGLSEQRGTQVAEQVTIAESNAATAVYQGGIASSIGLAAQSQLDLEGPVPERSVLLGSAALQYFPYTWQAERALGTALQRSRAVQIIPASDTMYDAVWSADGAWLATASEADGGLVAANAGQRSMVHLWNTSTYVESPLAGADVLTALDLDWSPEGARLAAATSDNAVWIWDAPTGEVLVTLTGHTGTVNRVLWSPDGTRIASGSSDTTLRLWDTATGEELLTLDANLSRLYVIEWSPDGSRIASADADNTVHVWDAANGDEISSFLGGDIFVHAITWSPDGSRIAAAGDNTPHVWDAETGEELLTLTGNNDLVMDLEWSPDATAIASSGYDGTIRLWNAETGDPLRVLNPQAGISFLVSWSLDGKMIAGALADGTIHVWNTLNGEEIFVLSGHRDLVRQMSWSPDGRQLATASSDTTARIWDVASRTLLESLTGHSDAVGDAAWSPDGTRIASASDDDSVRIWDAASGETLFTLQGRGDAVKGVAWSPDGSLLATASSYIGYMAVAESTEPTAVQIWDASTGSLLQTLGTERAQLGFDQVAFSSDGTMLAAASADGYVPIWDVDSGDLLITIIGQELSSVNSVAWSPQAADGGERLAIAYYNGVVGIWDSSTLTETPQGDVLIDTGVPTFADVVEWSPDGRHLATSDIDRMVRIWDAVTGTLLITLEGHTDYVTDVAWSLDGTRLASTSLDGTLRVWDTINSVELYIHDANSIALNSVAWSPDGSRLLTGSIDESVGIWRTWATTADLIEFAQTCCVARQFTQAEAIQFGLP
ncbi:MAG: TIR domain-containing protein [Burkholderiales bacterium]|nr:TIR domain-containing protein [Anaerolineae bacterium]